LWENGDRIKPPLRFPARFRASVAKSYYHGTSLFPLSWHRRKV